MSRPALGLLFTILSQTKQDSDTQVQNLYSVIYKSFIYIWLHVSTRSLDHLSQNIVQAVRKVMAHGDAWEGK